ncbi:putative periplasmic dipeptidase [Parvularcula bermudensis HTCC2503]|uniref:Putative periplasmic dipeptidase n=1 Tax=Parvularcula bermudensis (strain ATCC BAA-594 / HTCC2503 / KCTC 12087) TaxID=314260 RepID=E0TE12_PARBH|nr:dipeptidase [Parvularcula bermudensis]ADM08833.1 putative periplasmic dipeptidase [Parvularcula bermudensis HTCC2503]
MLSRLLLASVAVIGLSPLTAAAQDSAPSEKAVRLAKETVILDGHVDIPFRLFLRPEDISVETEGGDFDYVRAMEGGLNAPFMSIYVPARLQDTPGAAKAHADELIALVEALETDHPDKFEVATSVADVKRITKAGKIALPMGMENGAPIETDLSRLDEYYEKGIRYITLAHSKPNAISDSSYDINRPNGGLSPFGKEVVTRMNELGIIVDVSHISDAAFWDVMELTDVPVMASHSSARAFTPGFERNMDDNMIKRVGEENGVIMINFGSAFLKGAFTDWQQKKGAAFARYLKAEGIDEPDMAVRFAFDAGYAAAEPKPYATVDDVLDHIDHVVELAGVESVGLGSDFDGVGDSLPVGLKDASDMPNLVQGLMDRGYSDKEIKMMLSENAFRVWTAVEMAAK